MTSYKKRAVTYATGGASRHVRLVREANAGTSRGYVERLDIMKGAGQIRRNRDDGGFELRYEMPGLRANSAKPTL